jgi:Uncharacterized protein conserved in bacteria (DUF2147)
MHSQQEWLALPDWRFNSAICRSSFQEVTMKRMLAVAVFLLASSTAHARYEFQYGGRTIRIDPVRGTVSIPGVYDNTGRKSKRARDQDGKTRQSPQEAKVSPQTPPPPASPSPVATAPASPPAATTTTVPDPTTANVPPTDTAAQPPPPPPPQPSVPAPAIRDPNSPIGVWLTEEKEGKVRIEPCGPNLCGYSVDAKTNLNGDQVLINMKPAQGLKWTGRIHNPNTGGNYNSTIALKGDTLRVQGCAFGGMFCGGQNWSRVN